MPVEDEPIPPILSYAAKERPKPRPELAWVSIGLFLVAAISIQTPFAGILTLFFSVAGTLTGWQAIERRQRGSVLPWIATALNLVTAIFLVISLL